MIEVTIAYPEFDERLLATMTTPGIAQLAQFSHFMPLIPGDTVRVSPQGRVSGLMNARPVFVVEAYFRMDTRAVADAVEQWGRATLVEQSSPLTVYVVSESLQWIQDEVMGHAEVEMVHPIRVPDELFSWSKRVREA